MDKLVDKFGRPMRDLRISVTDRCNFRCTYCMPKEIFGDNYQFLPQEAILTFEEITRLTKIFVHLGVEKIRLTGGEPLLRKDIPILVEQLNRIAGVKDIGLTTNGVLLGKLAKPLYDAGLRRLNISLDALDPIVFGELNGRNTKPDIILRHIELARDMGFQVKVNMVVQKNINEQEILPLATHFMERGITLRFIEFMDVGNDNGWSFEKVVTKKEILTILESEFDLEPMDANYFGEVAQRYRYRENGAEVGFITSVSESFCSSCTRARISSNGKLYTCLFASGGFDVKELLRSEKTDEQLIEAISAVWGKRRDRYSDERTEQTIKNRKKINMSYIGG